MVCRSPPAEKARPSPSITSTRISSLPSTSAASCSSFCAIDRLMELKAAGRLSVMVAIGPSIRSRAGASAVSSEVGMARPPVAERGRHLNRRSQEVTIPGRACKMRHTPPGRGALASVRAMRSDGACHRSGADTSAAPKGRDRQAEISGEETTWVIPVCSNVGCPYDGRTGCHHWRGPCRLSACDVAAPARLFGTHRAPER